MKLLTTSSLLATVLLFACNVGADKQASSTEITNVPANYVPAPTNASTVKNVILPQALNNIPVSRVQPVTTSVSQPSANQSTATGLNPAHGMPGHRCDLAVGAPLTSAPAKQTVTRIDPSAIQTVTTTPNVNSVVSNPPVAKGMNPAHGQPGHRCDIAVGQPLNSPVKPAVTVSKDSAQASSLQTIADTAALASGVKLNPAHGQPGHDCKIPVGKPLTQ